MITGGHRIKVFFIWALGELTEMTKTVRVFRLHYIPELNKFHSRADFFGITREKHETAEDA